MPIEERKKIQDRKDAEALKAKGNEFYKAKKLDEALDFYQQAIDKLPEEPIFNSNKAAVWFEKKNFEKCVAECEEGLSKCKGENYDYQKTGKLMARKANALMQMQ